MPSALASVEKSCGAGLAVSFSRADSRSSKTVRGLQSGVLNGGAVLASSSDDARVLGLTDHLQGMTLTRLAMTSTTSKPKRSQSRRA